MEVNGLSGNFCYLEITRYQDILVYFFTETLLSRRVEMEHERVGEATEHQSQYHTQPYPTLDVHFGLQFINLR